MLRGIAAIAVILYHLRLWEAKAVGDRGVTPEFFLLGEGGVDLFFVISGFIMSYIQLLPLSDAAGYKRFLINRVTRVFPPFWIVSMILLPVYFARPELFNNYYHHKVDLIRSFLLLPQDYTPLLGVGWTLIHEVYFYLITSLLLIFSTRWRSALSIGWFLIVLCVYCKFGQNNFDGNRGHQLIFSPFSLTFLLGFFLGISYSKSKLGNPWLGTALIAAALCCLVWVQSLHLQWGVYPNNNSLYRFWCFGVPCALLVAGAVLLEQATRQRFRSLWHLGNESYSLYLVHLPVLSVTYKFIANIPSRNNTVLTSAMFLFVIGAVLVALAFHRFVELPSIKFFRNLMDRQFGVTKTSESVSASAAPTGGV